MEYLQKGLVIRGIATIILLVLVAVFWAQIVDSVASVLTGAKGQLESPADALVVANYLLVALIVVTILVEFVPFLTSWLNRPRVSLRSISHFGNGSLRIKKQDGAEKKLGIRTIYLEIWNAGRSPSYDPVVLISLTDWKISKWSPIPINTDAVWLDKSITALDANAYDEQRLDDLAMAFMSRGMKRMDYVPGRGDGKRFVLGFSFEGGKNFYFPSLESALLAKPDLAEGKRQYLHVQFHARNSPKKILRTNIPAYFESWNKVKFDYRAVEPADADSKQV